KVDNTWRVAGKPDLKVQPEAIQATLDALAGLKALRYAEDKSKELPLYGLEPPQLALEIQTRSGKRVLHIGRPEGESKRHYARVSEGDRADVFVIAENDAGRIVRNLAAFTRGKGRGAVLLVAQCPEQTRSNGHGCNHPARRPCDAFPFSGHEPLPRAGVRLARFSRALLARQRRDSWRPGPAALLR